MTVIKSFSEARDPFVFYHKGCFYHCFSNGGAKVFLSKAKTPEGLISAPPKQIFDASRTPFFDKIWAPEMHNIDGKWFLYYTAASETGSLEKHRILVAQNGSDDPEAEFSFYGRVQGAPDVFGIDQTVFRLNGELYTSWTACSQMYLAKMQDPFTVSSPIITLCAPEYEWEKQMSGVNEGPCALQKNGRTFLLFSASDSRSDGYCVGLLEYTGGDVLNASSWKKYPAPVFAPTENAKGVGHCSVCTDTETDKNYLTYHVFRWDGARGGAQVDAVMQEFTFDADGFPVFGNPQYVRQKENRE